mmetsp:Transcript_44713/g.117243  ORF Transcript_44713/g.117243 Transcript_44713/m.117243 type:complete len:289 (-) Transcript_44713:131-997(-)
MFSATRWSARAARLVAASTLAGGVATLCSRSPALATSKTTSSSSGEPRRAAIVVGVSHSPGLGYAIAKRFAEGGLSVGIIGRQTDRLEDCRAQIMEAVPGADVIAVAADATNAAEVRAAFAKLKADHGPADCLVYNMSCRPFPPTTVADLDPDRLLSDIKTGPYAALLCVQAVLPAMLEAGRGTLLLSGASASLRGNEQFGSFAAAKTSLRAMAQALAKEVAPSNVHVAHVVVDALVDMPIIHSFLPEVSKGRLLDTTAAAETYWQLYKQDPRCMTFELDIRPFEAKW